MWVFLTCVCYYNKPSIDEGILYLCVCYFFQFWRALKKKKNRFEVLVCYWILRGILTPRLFGFDNLFGDTNNSHPVFTWFYYWYQRIKSCYSWGIAFFENLSVHTYYYNDIGLHFWNTTCCIIIGLSFGFLGTSHRPLGRYAWKLREFLFIFLTLFMSGL